MNRSIQITALVRQKAIIPHADFPDLLQAFLDTDDNSKRTQALEASGYALRTNTQMKWDKLESFIKDVCRWGDYAGVYGRVLNPKNNPRSKIELKVRTAISLLNSTPPDLIGALESMTEIKHLGVSFASKHLRCLFPEYCPVLDSILSNRLFYELSASGYKSFATACNDIAEELNGTNIVCPFPGKPSWRPSDVEAALFAWVNEWK